MAAQRGGGAGGPWITLGDRIRRRREELGLNQDVVAPQIGRSPRWYVDLEGGKLDPPLGVMQALASVLKTDLDWILEEFLVTQRRGTIGASKGKLELEEAEDTLRRRFLQHLVTLLAGAGMLDGQRLVTGLTDPQRVDGPLLDDLETFTRSFVERRHTTPPKVLLSLADGHLKMLSNLLDTSADLRLYRLTSETAWLAGWLAFRADRRVHALAYASFAESASLEANDGPRRALALLLRAHLHSSIPRGGRLGNTALALAALNEAEAAAGPGAPPLMRTELLARRAEEHAVAGDRAASERDLDAAVRALSHDGGDDLVFGHWNLGLVAGFRGHCLHLLEEPLAAADLLQQAVQNMDPALNRSVAVADLGAAYADARDLDHACAELHHALDLAEHAGLTFAVQRVHGIRAKHLAAHSAYPAVRQLDQRLGLSA
jgi:transcriptional regulator with XRE-family HTH domain